MIPEESSIESPKAALLLIGSEIASGKIQDSHAKKLSALLSGRGIEVRFICIVPDSEAIDADIRRLAETVELLLLTGGLGPTSDDMTRESVAKAAGVELVFREDLWLTIKALFPGGEPAPSNRRQAEIPEGFTPIANSCGTAPGFVGRIGEATLVALPGPPRELDAMVSSFLNGYLDRCFPRTEHPVTTWTAFLVPESLLEDTIAGISGPEDTWRTRAEGHRIVFELATPRGSSRIVESLKRKLGGLLIREGETSAPALLNEALLASGKLLVCAESCTGGLIGKMITDLPGSSNVFWGSLVTYANDAKRKVLSVSAVDSHGAVSRETVIEMTEGAINVSGADIALAVSGIAGPDGGSKDKPVGTVWIAVKTREATADAWEFRFRGNRDRVRLRAAVAAMLLAESRLTGVCVDSDLFSTYT